MCKNFIKIALAATVAVMIFAACGTGGGDASDASAAGNQGAAGQAAAGETPAADGPTRRVVVGIGENPVMLTYLAERFNQERDPNIEIEIFYNGEWMGNEQMAQLVAAGQMPDILYIENPLFPMQNDWLIDLSPFAAQEEYIPIPEAYLRYGMVGDQLVMLPAWVFTHGVMVNLSLLDAENIPRPGYDWTIDEFVEIITLATRPGDIIGTNASAPLLEHLPAQLNRNLGWSSFNRDARQYQLSPEWVQAANLAYTIANNNLTLFDQLDRHGNHWEMEEGSEARLAVEEARRNALWEVTGVVGEDWHPWVGGRAATWFDFSWAMGFDVWNPDIFTGFEWDFYPFPRGYSGAVPRPGIVVDSVGISTLAPHPEAAWEFIKWITYEPDGLNARFDFVENWNREEARERWPGWPEGSYPEVFTFGHMPPTNDPAIIDRWVNFNDAVPGLRFILENLDAGYVDGFKVTPGHVAATDIINGAFRNEVMTGRQTAADIANEVEAMANQVTAEAFASIGLD
jgi:ABC-type glycerol-3-phosphate transport system substrate-binding protein